MLLLSAWVANNSSSLGSGLTSKILFFLFTYGPNGPYLVIVMNGQFSGGLLLVFHFLGNFNCVLDFRQPIGH